MARQLKYSGGGTDLDRLRAELGVDSDRHGSNGDSAYADLDDRYAGDDDDSDDAQEEDEDEDWQAADDSADSFVRPSRSSTG